MTYTELKAKPGSYIYNDSGLAVGRINNDLTEDNRFTAFGKCSIANGIIKASGYTPKNPESFHKAVQSKPNGYVLMGYTVCLELSELPVEMWCVKAAEILGGEYEDLKEMLTELSKQPEVERQAKLTSLSKMFAKEKKAIKRKPKLSKAAKENIDWLFTCLRDPQVKTIEYYFDLNIGSNGWVEADNILVVRDLILIPYKEGKIKQIDWLPTIQSLGFLKRYKSEAAKEYFNVKLAEYMNDTSIKKRRRDPEYFAELAIRFIRLRYKQLRIEWESRDWSNLDYMRKKIDPSYTPKSKTTIKHEVLESMKYFDVMEQIILDTEDHRLTNVRCFYKNK